MPKKAKTTTAKKTQASKQEKSLAPDKTVITVVLDESGSMNSVWDSTIAGFNKYVSSVREELRGQPVYFSALKFDTRGVRILQKGEHIESAVVLSRANYQPNGGTPLIDAAAKTILATDEVIRKEGAQKVIVVIQTDGEENSSTEYKLHELKAMIEERQGRGWQFVFLGAGINAFLTGTSFGINAMNTMSYGANAAHTQAVFASTAQNSASYSKGLLGSMAYSAGQSRAAGESASILRAKMASVSKAADQTDSLDDISLTE